MPATIDWYLENKIVHVIASGDIDANTISESMNKAVEFIEKSDEVLVHILVDVHAPARPGECGASGLVS